MVLGPRLPYVAHSSWALTALCCPLIRAHDCLVLLAEGRVYLAWLVQGEPGGLVALHQACHSK